MAPVPLKLLRLDVEGFGCLAGSFSFDAERATLLLAPNEEGKSTLARALAAVLYGLERDRRRARGGGVLEVDRFRPWSGGPYAASIEIERGGMRFHVRRDFERDDLSVRDGAGRDVTAEYRTREGDEAGERLVGLSRAEFERTVFITHEEKALEEAAGLTARLQSLASAETGATAAAAMQALASAVDAYADARTGGRIKASTEISRLEKQLADLAAERLAIEKTKQELSVEFEARERSRAEAEAADAGATRERHFAVRAEEAEVAAAIHSEEERVAEIARFAGRRDELADAASFPAAQANAVASAWTQIEGLRESAARKEEGLRKAEAALEAGRARLAQLGPASAASAEDRDEVMRVQHRLAQITEDTEDAVRAHVEEKTKLQQRGIDPTEIEALERSFAALGAEERDLAAGVEEFERTTEAERREAQGASEHARLTAEGVRRGRREKVFWGALLVVVGCAVAGVSFLAPPPGRWVALALGGLLVAGGLVVMFVSVARGGEAIAKAQAATMEAERRLAEIHARAGERAEAMAALLERTGYDEAGRLARDYARWIGALTEIGGFRQSDEHLQLIDTARRDTQKEAAATLSRWGVAPEGETVGERQLSELAERMRRAESGRGEIEESERDVARRGTELSDERKRLGLAREALAEILRSAGVAITDAEAPEGSTSAFTERLRRHEEWKALEETALPTARRARHGDAWLEEKRERAARLRAAIEEGRRPEWDGLAPEAADEHRARAAALADQARRLRETSHEVEQKMSGFLERDQPRMAAILASEEDLARSLGKAKRFQAAVETAFDTLEEVSHETFATWSQALNDLAAELVPTMHPGIESVRFLEDLGLSVRVAGGRELSREEATAYLSAGARDQLALLVRVAISEFLSRGEVLLPFILDDPFARADDARFAQVFRFLVERCAGRHQLLVCSCHEGRHAALEAEDPAWFAAHVSRLALTTAQARA